jgi:YHS domain-containing protein
MLNRSRQRCFPGLRFTGPRCVGPVVVAIAAWIASDAHGGVPWHTNLAGAKAASTVSQRPVLVVFTAAWSEASVNLEATALGSDEAVALLTACYEPVRIDVDADPALQRSMGVSRLPSACVLDQHDNVVARFDIPAAPAAFVAAAGRAAQQAAMANTSPVKAATAAPAAAPPSPQPTLADVAGSARSPSTDAPPHEPTLPTTAPAWPAERVSRPVPVEGLAQTAPTGTPAVPTQPNPAAAGPTTAPPDAQATRAPASGTSWLGHAAAPPPPTQPPAKSASRMPAWDALQKSIAGFVKLPSFKPAKTATAPAASPAPAQATTAQPAAVAIGTAPTAGPGGGADAGESMPVGLDGYCPVTLMDKGMWAEGRAQWGVRHRGRTYLFAGAAEQHAFLGAPDRYAPGLSGDDPVIALDAGRQVQGQRRYGVTYQSRMYLFSSAETRATFAADPQRYTSRVTVAEQPPGADRTVTR